MRDVSPATLKELHHIRAQLAQEERRLSPHERLARTHRAAETLLRQWGLSLKRIPPPVGVAKS